MKTSLLGSLLLALFGAGCVASQEPPVGEAVEFSSSTQLQPSRWGTDIVSTGFNGSVPPLELSPEVRIRMLEQRLADAEARLGAMTARAEANEKTVATIVARLDEADRIEEESKSARLTFVRAAVGGGDAELCPAKRVRISDSGLSTPEWMDSERERGYVMTYTKCR